jgi:DNA-binding XRE family transcriptional regulator
MLAQKAGIERKTVNRIENGHFSPNLSTLIRVCKALKVKPSEVLEGI